PQDRAAAGREVCLAVLALTAGLSDQEEIDATLVLTRYVIGFAPEHDAADACSHEVRSADVSSASGERYPRSSGWIQSPIRPRRPIALSPDSRWCWMGSRRGYSEGRVVIGSALRARIRVTLRVS